MQRLCILVTSVLLAATYFLPRAQASASVGDTLLIVPFRVLETSHDSAGARSEAQEALRQRQLVEPLLVLARLDLDENKTESAASEIDQALRLEPSNSTTLKLKRTLAAKLALKAQPLPQP